MNEIMEILSPVLGEELARDIVAHRKGLKCPLTPRGAKALLRQYELTGTPVEAAEHQLNMGWRGFEAAWMKPKRNFRDEHNPMPVRQSANYGAPEPIAVPEVSPEEAERRRAMVAKLREQGVLGRALQ